jgi:hypothetical protein
MVQLKGGNLVITGHLNTTPVMLIPNYVSGTVFELKIVATGGKIYTYFNDMNTPFHTDSSTASGCYFKCGVYTLSNTSYDSADKYAEVVIQQMYVTHN